MSVLYEAVYDSEAVARYEVQLAEIDETLDDLGLLVEAEDAQGGAPQKLPTTLDAIFINMPSILAAPGSIYIEADTVEDTGGSTLSLSSLIGQQLFASNNTAINIRAAPTSRSST